MKSFKKIWLVLAIMAVPTLVFAQRKKNKNEPPPVDSAAIKKAAADSIAKVAYADSVSAKMKADSVAAVAMVADSAKRADSVANAKDCYTKYYETMRSRGAKPVPDGMQEVVIALKSADGCNCFLGKIEVVGGKMKPPLFFQQENGEYREVSVVGKKIDPAFASTMEEDQLRTISEGMSIVFRTTDGEYGRLFFYKYANKSAQGNKAAPSPSELIKD